MDRFLEARRAPDLVVLEGIPALEHALRFKAEILEVATGDPRALAKRLAPELRSRFEAVATEAGLPDDDVLTVAKRPPFSAEEALQRPGPVIYLARPSPAELGGAIRVAAAADAAAVLTGGPEDPWRQDALTASIGLHFALPVGHVDQPPRPLVAFARTGDDAKIPRNAVLAFGVEDPDTWARLPTHAGVSLDVPTALAAVLYGLMTS